MYWWSCQYPVTDAARVAEGLGVRVRCLQVADRNFFQRTPKNPFAFYNQLKLSNLTLIDIAWFMVGSALWITKSPTSRGKDFIIHNARVSFLVTRNKEDG